MKNKNFIIYTILLIMLFANYSYGEDFKFEAAEIKILDKGNIVQSSGDVKIISNDNLEIIADKSIYDKDKSILKLEGNISVNDTQNNVKIFTNKINYFKKKEIIIAEKKVRSEIKGKYTIDSAELIFDRNLLEISSSNRTTLKDNFENIFSSDNFLFRIKGNKWKKIIVLIIINLFEIFKLNPWGENSFAPGVLAKRKFTSKTNK